LLAATESGAALPVGDLRVKRSCGLKGDAAPLATFSDNTPLLARVPGRDVGVYFLSTTTSGADSSLLAQGVVAYAVVQRALTQGARNRSQSGGVDAGAVAAEEAVDWQQVAGPTEALSDEYAYVGGVYETQQRLTAVNRSVEEDLVSVVADSTVDKLFDGLRFDRIADQTGSFEALAKEVWRLFLAGMMIALFIEAVLCLPKVKPAEVQL
jgi:hypothetical protein